MYTFDFYTPGIIIEDVQSNKKQLTIEISHTYSTYYKS